MKRILALLTLCLSCNPSLLATGKRYPAECRGPGQFLETMTWNVGLAPGVVPYATPRIKPVAEELAKFRDLGVICLQEATWTKEGRDAILASLALPDERVYYVDTQGMGEEPPGSNVCTPGQIDPLVACVQDNCADIEHPEETTVCANRECHSELVSLYIRGGRECLDCLAASVGKGLGDIEARCTKPAPGITRAYEGRNGAMLISRWPLVNRSWEMLPASYSNRVALYATIELEGHEALEVACTHISTATEISPAYKEDGRSVFDDWDDEMIKQIAIISDTLSRRAGSRPQLLMGDINAGPAIGSYIQPDMSRVWGRIIALGFSSPAVQAERPFCSVCNGNSLRDPTANDKLIDHVLARDPLGGSILTPLCTRSVLDAEHKRYFQGYGGMMEEHLSDHYGVTVTFRYD